MRLPGGVLFVALALLALWIGITGRFDKFGQAWNVLKSNDAVDTKGASGGGGGGRGDTGGGVVTPASLPNNVLDPATWGRNAMAFALRPTVNVVTSPGGQL